MSRRSWSGGRSREAGHQARSLLLSEDRRRELVAAVTEHRESTELVRSQRDRALTAAERLADTGYGSADHRAAGAEFRSARSRMAAAESRVQSVSSRAGCPPSAEPGRRGEDRVGGHHRRGGRAWTALQTRLRTGWRRRWGRRPCCRRGSPPRWGRCAPADDTERWMETAADLVAYRITYRVGDPVVALGQRPGEGAGVRQRLWWQQWTRRSVPSTGEGRVTASRRRSRGEPLVTSGRTGDDPGEPLVTSGYVDCRCLWTTACHWSIPPTRPAFQGSPPPRQDLGWPLSFPTVASPRAPRSWFRTASGRRNRL